MNAHGFSRCFPAALLLAGVAAGACTTREAPSSGVAVADVYITEPVLGERAAMYFTMANHGDVDDALLAVATRIAGRAEIHRNVRDGDAVRMEPTDSLPVTAGSKLRLVPGGHHVMLLDLRSAPAAGDTIAATLTFRSAGTVEIAGVVVTYAELEDALGNGSGAERGSAHEGRGARD